MSLQDSISLDDAPQVAVGTRTPTPNLSRPSSSLSARPSAHTQKYDRQLRLWASSGQAALETASILVINGTAAASSTLKNLVLPGIGQFTILDSAMVTPADVGHNFFLTPDSIGKPRALEVTKYLQELNSDVKGNAIVKDLAQVLSETPDLLTQYTLIIAVEVPPAEMRRVGEIAWESGIPLIKVRSCGFYASLRVQVKEITLVETHPESLIDLRLHTPFPALIEYASTFDYSTMDSAAHGHVPAVVILIKALEEWRATHGGNNPASMAERRELVNKVLEQKIVQDEENFDEAVTLFRRAGTKSGVPSEVQELFNDPCCENIDASSTNFWLLVHTLRLFSLHPSHPIPLLPLPGALPDMKADTTGYVGLQTIYKTKAREDLALFEQLLEGVLEKVGVEKNVIGQEEVESFVKHSAWLKVLRGRSLKSEDESPALAGKLQELYMTSQAMEARDDALSIYLGFKASEIFAEKYGRYPGTLAGDGQEDYSELGGIAKAVVKSLKGGEVEESLENVLKEICRAGASDMPQIAALLGGLVAQEAIKLTTRQYIPLNSTCVFNGISSATGIVDA
ncbi:amyloid beta precursor protein binding protein 1 [Pseudohyphozyma bogoriensis]|nr:amyloid beta precursor protein binding protein 1 [Pseudohyphozyma bogoriensis]